MSLASSYFCSLTLCDTSLACHLEREERLVGRIKLAHLHRAERLILRLCVIIYFAAINSDFINVLERQLCNCGDKGEA